MSGLPRVQGLDGREYKWNYSHKTKSSKASSLHKKAKELIDQELPSYTYFEEVLLPGTKVRAGDKNLIADFYIPALSVIIEVHGSQHYHYNGHFFKDRMQWYRFLRRDKDKKRWCIKNDLIHVELPYNEVENWKNILLESLNF